MGIRGAGGASISPRYRTLQAFFIGKAYKIALSLLGCKSFSHDVAIHIRLVAATSSRTVCSSNSWPPKTIPNERSFSVIIWFLGVV